MCILILLLTKIVQDQIIEIVLLLV
jgi:hypothetical protein